MSRVGKRPILIPAGVEIKIEGELIKVKGPLGELSLATPGEIKVEKEENSLVVSEKKETKRSRAMWGTIRSLLFNMVEGVTSGYRRELELQGVGYRAEMQGEKLILKVGFSHPVEIIPPSGISVAVEKNTIVISGIKKELVMRVAAEIRKIRPPDPYKGKGIRYKGEVIVLKEGKKGAGK